LFSPHEYAFETIAGQCHECQESNTGPQSRATTRTRARVVNCDGMDLPGDVKEAKQYGPPTRSQRSENSGRSAHDSEFAVAMRERSQASEKSFCPAISCNFCRSPCSNLV